MIHPMSGGPLEKLAVDYRAVSVDRFCEALVRGLCHLHGWDADRIWGMASGLTPPTPEVAELWGRLFGLGPEDWPIAPVAQENGSGYGADMEQVRAMRGVAAERALRLAGRRRRRLTSPVHDVLDKLDWTIKDLSQAISRSMRKSVSRASVQFWAVGQRQVKNTPSDTSRLHAVQAPLAVRLAAEKVTAREAKRRGLGEAGILRPTAWPNVELE